jgi:exonuclease III
LKELENQPVIVFGDLNVAHKEIDLKNLKTNRRNAVSLMKSEPN